MDKKYIKIETSCDDCGNVHEQKIQMGIPIQEFVDQLIRVCPFCKGNLYILPPVI